MAYLDWLVPASVFALVCFSSHRVGRFFLGARLPLITGFLVTGILIGPFVLALLSAESLAGLPPSKKRRLPPAGDFPCFSAVEVNR